MKTFNLTEKRIEALRWLAQRPDPCYVSYLTENCYERPEYTTGRRPTFTAQNATRVGAKHARALAEAGLVNVVWKMHGWGTVAVSLEGRNVLGAFDRDDGTLPAALERARAAGERRQLWWRR